MATDSSTGIAVIGGGVVGLACAIRLAMEEVSVLLVVGSGGRPEPDDEEASAWDARTYALNHLSCHFLKQIGALPLIKRYGVFEAMDVWDMRGGRMHFSATDIGEARLGIVLEHTTLLSALWTRVQALSNIECVEKSIGSIEFAPQGRQTCHLRFDDDDCRDTGFVIGADGAHSAVRQQAGIEWEWRDYRQTAQAAVVKVENEHRRTCLQQFSSAGIAALLPLPGKTCAAIWSHARPTSADELEQFFSRQMGLGQVEIISQLASLPLYGGMAKSFIAPYCLLVGDAAHNIHPMAGQGANLGFGDLFALFNALQQSPVKEFTWSVLRRYQRMTVANNRIMKGGIEGLLALSNRDDRLSAFLRHTVYDCVDRSVGLKKRFMRYAGGACYRDY